MRTHTQRSSALIRGLFSLSWVSFALYCVSFAQEQCLRLASEGHEEEEAARIMSRGHLLLLFSTIVDSVASENVSA